MTVYGRGLGTLWKLLESYDIDPRRVINESDFTPGEEGRTSARIPFARYDRLRTRAAELIGDPLAGLRSAAFIHPSGFGAIGHSWLASPSLLTGLRRIVRYARMFNESETWLLDEGPVEVVLTAKLSTASQRPDEIADSLIAGMTALCRLNYGEALNPDRVTLARPTPEDPGPWFSYFRCPVTFASDANRLVLSMTKATKPLPGADPEMVAMHDQVIQRYLASLDREDVLSRARVEITEQLPSGGVSEESVAQALNTTKRTLHRRLQEQGETFRSLLTSVRRDLVTGYLGNRGLNLTEVAFLLGFSDASAFSRAFRSWFGRSPSAARADLVR